MRSCGFLLSLLLLIPIAACVPKRLPILDMHLHAMAADSQGPPPLGLCVPFEEFPPWEQRTPYSDQFLSLLKSPPCPRPIWSSLGDAALRKETLAVMERRNIIGVVSGSAERVAEWQKEAPQRLLPALEFQLGAQTPSLDFLRALHRQGRLVVLGEIMIQYAGIAPDDPRMEPYWSLAEELDLPVGIHIGTGPPGAIYLGATGYRARLHSPLSLEEVLVKHPRLRIYVMHAGFPMLDDLLAVLYAHPQVYVDLGVISYTQPRAVFYRFLKGILDAGFGNRVLFGSDQMVWPAAIEKALSAIEQAHFLSFPQQRDILYNNAARFLRLTEQQRAQHLKM